MPCTVTSDPSSRIVLVRYSGTMVPEETNEARSKTAAELALARFRKVLIDLTEIERRSGFSIASLYRGGLSWSETMPRDVRVAVLYSPKTSGPRDVGFFETVATNRGVSMKTFQKMDEALAWLNSADADKA